MRESAPRQGQSRHGWSGQVMDSFLQAAAHAPVGEVMAVTLALAMQGPLADSLEPTRQAAMAAFAKSWRRE